MTATLARGADVANRGGDDERRSPTPRPSEACRTIRDVPDTALLVSFGAVLIALGSFVIAVRADRRAGRAERRTQRGQPVVHPRGGAPASTADRVYEGYGVRNVGQAAISDVMLWVEDAQGNQGLLRKDRPPGGAYAR
jgi:hypothetical protein